MSTNEVKKIQRTSAGHPVDTPTIRRSVRLKTAKGTFGEAAARVSPPNTQDAGLADDVGHSHRRTSIPIVSKKSNGTVDDIIYATETDSQQYVRVTIRDHRMEENSVFLVCYRKITLALIQAC